MSKIYPVYYTNFFTATLAAQGTMQQISKPRPANENIQPKQPTSRPLNILPSNAANIRPASSVSTQTIMGAQQPVCIRFLWYVCCVYVCCNFRLPWEISRVQNFGQKRHQYVLHPHLKPMLPIRHKSSLLVTYSNIMLLRISKYDLLCFLFNVERFSAEC